jgi:mannose-6-phosphate isomerase-like protein (cupin superfamily)
MQVTSDLNNQRWEWSDELDAVVAAPAHHHVLLENERVRVLETRIEPGDVTTAHTHRWPNVQYVLSGADFVRYDGDGGVALDTRAGAGPPRPETTLWSGPLPPHSLENVGETELRVIMVEVKDRTAGNRK